MRRTCARRARATGVAGGAGRCWRSPARRRSATRRRAGQRLGGEGIPVVGVAAGLSEPNAARRGGARESTGVREVLCGADRVELARPTSAADRRRVIERRFTRTGSPRVQAAPVERAARLRAHHGLGAEGDREPGLGHHLQVVRAVADGDASGLSPPSSSCSTCAELRRLGIGVDDVADQRAGELAVLHLEHVGDRVIAGRGAALRRSVKKVKPPETSSSFTPCLLQAAIRTSAPGVSFSRCS